MPARVWSRPPPGFIGLPTPANEPEADRRLREAITADVLSYFASANMQRLKQQGQELPG